jgi:hypothetical protein
MPLQDESLLQAALLGLELQKQRVEDQITQLRSMLGKRGPGRPPRTLDMVLKAAADGAAPPPARKKRRKMTPEGRARIAEAQRRRWAALKG